MKEMILHSDLAKKLYQSVKHLPIIDYHNHLSLADLKNNRRFENITQLWIIPDPYKHRLMRICGVEEKYITGNSCDYDKFLAWCKVFPTLVGTPVYDWSLLEFQNVFDIDLPINQTNALKIWELTNEKLQDEEYTVYGLISRFNVEYSAPCASICEDVDFYANTPNFAPSLRADDILSPNKLFVEKLERITNIKISTLNDYYKAIEMRINYFKSLGCKFCDHALDNGFRYSKDQKEEDYFKLMVQGNTLTKEQSEALKSDILFNLGCIYSKKNLTMLLHVGALRQTSDRLKSIAGPAGGFAGIGNDFEIASITKLLNDIECKNGLCRTVIFTLNPAYNAIIATLSGSFSKDGVPSVVSQGPAWWWCDHLEGMREFFDKYSVYSVLSQFIGMTTDSRSFLSFVRHDYYRRVLCQWLADKIESNQFNADENQLLTIVKKLSYENAKKILEE